MKTDTPAYSQSDKELLEYLLQNGDWPVFPRIYKRLRELLDAQPHWTPVSGPGGRLPMVCDCDGDGWFLAREARNRTQTWNIGWPNQNYTHWMPLPPPPVVAPKTPTQVQAQLDEEAFEAWGNASPKEAPGSFGIWQAALNYARTATPATGGEGKS